MEAETLGITLHDSLTELWAEAPGDKLSDVNASNVAETLTDLKAASPIVTLAPTLGEMKAETGSKALSDVKAQTVLDTLSATQSDTSLCEARMHLSKHKLRLLQMWKRNQCSERSAR